MAPQNQSALDNALLPLVFSILNAVLVLQSGQVGMFACWREDWPSTASVRFCWWLGVSWLGCQMVINCKPCFCHSHARLVAGYFLSS